MQKKARNYVFTINNWTDSEYENLQAFAESCQCKYIVLGKEEGGEQETPHIQGYCELAGARTFKWLAKQPGFARAHIEIRKGSGPEAASYCKKDGTWWEKGAPKKTKPTRGDLESIRDEIKGGASELEIAEKHFAKWVVYRRSFSRYRELLNQKRKRKSWTVLLVGTTNTGKSRFVWASHPDDDVWTWPGDRWFDGYRGQSVALFDDFRGELDAGVMLRLCDRYPMDVPVKGGFTNWNPKRIYITSNIMPEMWWGLADQETMRAFWRRINTFHRIDEPIFDE